MKKVLMTIMVSQDFIILERMMIHERKEVTGCVYISAPGCKRA